METPAPALRFLPPAIIILGLLVVAFPVIPTLGKASAGEAAAAPRVLAPGERPPDRRLGDIRTLDSHCPFTPPATLAAWRTRADELRRQIRVALGLWPWPTRTASNARIHSTTRRADYIVEKVVLESLPGHYVTGNVFRPAGRTGRLPAVLSPHGHWPGGRFQNVSDEDARQALASGAETLEVAARHFLEARAVHLARLGAVTFLLDLEGFADSQQLGADLVHGFSTPRPDMERREGWGFFSPQAELHLQSVQGLVIWNAVRALDYLASRPDVDPARIGVTGASGGGTQTFLLAAIDQRPAAFFPAVMVSTHMQGGCTCENASYLRVGTNNAEIAALAAPRPLGLTAADDWTKEFEHDGYPDLRRVYELQGVPERVRLWPFLQFPHNYSAPSRAAMYEWFNQYLALGWTTVAPERTFMPLSLAEASVWDAAHPRPRGGSDHERAVVEWMTRDAAQVVSSAMPRSPADWSMFTAVVGGAWTVMLGGGWSPDERAAFEERGRTEADGRDVTVGLITRSSAGTAVPAVILSPRGPRRGVVVWADERGKSVLFEDDAVEALVARLLSVGYEVLGLDTFEQGEFRPQGRPIERVRLGSPRAHAGYTFAYNRPLPAERTQDVLAAVRVARTRADRGRVVLVGRGAAAAWAAGARWLAGTAIDAAAIDFAGYTFERADRIDHPDLLPGAIKYGDVDALAALGAPGPLWLGGAAPNAFPIAGAAYRIRGQKGFVRSPGALGGEAVSWLAAAPAPGQP